jgi:diacylglycerol kinase family enzyme
MASTNGRTASVPCDWQGTQFQLGCRSFGLHFETTEAKKLSGMVIKWFHLVSSTLDDAKAPNQIILHHARKQTFSSGGFVDSDPVPEVTADLKSLNVLKYPKLAFEKLVITFSTAKLAKKTHKTILKRLKSVGQAPGAKWHVWLNPSSGTGKSKKVWAQFDEWRQVAGVNAIVTETTYAGHCEQEALEMDLSGYQMLLTVSGDGMIHELINGLMRRPDWHRAMTVPIGVIPAGSGNALAMSMMFPSAISAFLAALKRQWKPLDIMAMYQYTAPEPELPADFPFSPRSDPPSTSKKNEHRRNSSAPALSRDTIEASGPPKVSDGSDNPIKDQALDANNDVQVDTGRDKDPKRTKGSKRSKSSMKVSITSSAPSPSSHQSSSDLIGYPAVSSSKGRSKTRGEESEAFPDLQSPRPFDAPKPSQSSKTTKDGDKYPDLGIRSPRAPITPPLIAQSSPDLITSQKPPRKKSGSTSALQLSSSHAIGEPRNDPKFGSKSSASSSSIVVGKGTESKSVPVSPSMASKQRTKTLTESTKKRMENRNIPRSPGQWHLVCYSFEAFMWGIISDVDLETDPWRWMGAFRFTLGTVRRIASLRHYPARLLTLDAPNEPQRMTTCKFHLGHCSACEWGAAQHHERFQRLESSALSHSESKDSKTVSSAPDMVEEVEYAPAERKSRRANRDASNSIQCDADPGSSVEKDQATTTPSDEHDTNTDSTTKKAKKRKTKSNFLPEPEEENQPDSPLESGILVSSEPYEEIPKKRSKKERKRNNDDAPVVEEPSSTSKQIEEQDASTKKSKKQRNQDSEGDKQKLAENTVSEEKPVIMKGLAPGLDPIIDFDPMTIGDITPAGWTDITSKFVYFVASNVSHLSGDVRAAPFAHSSDDSIDLIYSEKIAKMELLDLMAGSLENGRYVAHDKVTYKKVKALVLIPTGKSGVMDLDGEEYEAVPTALEVHPGAIRICIANWNLSIPDLE